MIDDHYIELINKEIDGVISSKERAKLKGYLKQNPKGQQFYDDHVKLSQLLNQVKHLDPPPNLKQNVLSSIQRSQSSIKEKRNLLQSLKEALSVRINYKLAYSFSAGLVVGLLIFALINSLNRDVSLDISQLTGTIIINGTNQNFESVEAIENENFGSIEVKSLNNVILAEFDISVPKEVKLTIKFDPHDIKFAGFRHLNNLISDLQLDDSLIQLISPGTTKFLLVFHSLPSRKSAMTFKITSGSSFFEKTVYINKNH